MPISALAYISYLLYPNYQCAKHTAVIYALKEMYSSHQDLTLEVGGIYFLYHAHDYDEDYSMDIAELVPDNLKAIGVL